MAIKQFNCEKARELGLEVTHYGNYPPECYEVCYEGAVLEIGEHNHYNDSDFYAIVWDEAEKRTKEIEYATTRAWTYNNSATVDATPEMIAKADEFWRVTLRASLEAGIREKYKHPYVGATVRVARGRKVPVGFTGKVLSLSKQMNPYTRSRWAQPETWALVQNDAGSYKVKVDHCDVIGDPAFVEEQVRQVLDRFDRLPPLHERGNWKSAPYQQLSYAGVDIHKMF